MTLNLLLRATRCASLMLCLLFGAAAPDACAQALRIGGTGSGLGTARLLGEAFAKEDSSHAAPTIVPNLGSTGGLRALQAGAIDIALISRPLKAEDLAAGLAGYEYGRSPFVFVTSKPGVKTLNASTIADFLSGRVMAWPDGQPVRVVLRPTTDGDHVYLASMSPEIAAALTIAHTRSGMVMAATDQDAADEAARLPGSLAVNTLAVLLSETRKLNVIAYNGATPSVNALAAGSYPYYKPCVMVTRGAPGGMAQRFIEFAKSPRGRAILEANGHQVVY